MQLLTENHYVGGTIQSTSRGASLRGASLFLPEHHCSLQLEPLSPGNMGIVRSWVGDMVLLFLYKRFIPDAMLKLLSARLSPNKD